MFSVLPFKDKCQKKTIEIFQRLRRGSRAATFVSFHVTQSVLVKVSTYLHIKTSDMHYIKTCSVDINLHR